MAGMHLLLALLAVVLSCDEHVEPRDAAPAHAPRADGGRDASVRPAVVPDAGGGPPDASAPAPPVEPDAGPGPAEPVPAPVGRPWRAGRSPAPWLCGAPIASIEPHSTGTNILFVLRFAGGHQAAFKPDQRSTYSHYRSEIAAYRLSELLGYGRVPPACARSVPLAALESSVVRDARLKLRVQHELLPGPDGRVAGAAIEWIADIRPWGIVCAEVPGNRLERELSDMIVFDALAGNYDRWSGTNVFVDPSSQGLVLIDNAAGFHGARIPSLERDLWSTLDCVRSPSPRLLAALSGLQRGPLSRALQGAGYGAQEVDGVLERRRRIVERLGVTP